MAEAAGSPRNSPSGPTPPTSSPAASAPSAGSSSASWSAAERATCCSWAAAPRTNSAPRRPGSSPRCAATPTAPSTAAAAATPRRRGRRPRGPGRHAARARCAARGGHRLYAPAARTGAGEFADALGGKAAGAWWLHLAARDWPLDFFVLVSSVSSVWGTQDCAAYSAANGALDLLAAHRVSSGCPR
ncbi:KR domain-containing protein [Streptomyces zhihengii]